MSGVAQADLAKELKIPPGRMKGIRDKHLARADWWVVPGKTGKIMISPEGERKLRILRAVERGEKHLVPTFLEVEVLGRCPNKSWIEIKVDHGERGTLKEACAVPRGLHSFMTRGKKIRVEVVRDVTGVSYRHENLATAY